MSGGGCACTNSRGNPKIRHRTKEAALDAAIKQAKAGRPARVYRCRNSDRWHVTTQARTIPAGTTDHEQQERQRE